MRCEYMRLLLSQQLTNRHREVLLQRVLVSLLRCVLTLLGRFKQRLIATTQLGLQVSP